MEQWYDAPLEPIVIGWLDAPGARLPVSTDPLSRTTRCVMLSMLCHTTWTPAGSVAGFGENDCAPLIATTLTVTIDAVVDVLVALGAIAVVVVLGLP
jgi:hypothetical protein